MPIKFRRPSIKVDKYPDNSRLVIIFSSTNFLLFLIKSIDFIDCYRMLSIIDLIDCKSQAVTHSPSARLPPFSGAPKRVNLFSFGCHVIDRAYVRTYVRVYRLYGWGRGDYQKRGSGVMANPHLLYWAFTIWSIDTCQNRIAADQYHMTISRAHVSTHRGDVIYLEAVRWPVHRFTRSRTMFNHTF